MPSAASTDSHTVLNMGVLLDPFHHWALLPGDRLSGRMIFGRLAHFIVAGRGANSMANARAPHHWLIAGLVEVGERPDEFS